jgi:hypothetical protein
VSAPAPATHDLDRFVVHAGADVAFVRESLLPALELPPARVLLVLSTSTEARSAGRRVSR